MKTLKTLLAWPFRSRTRATRPATPSPRRADRRPLLALECLEDRLSPATLTVNNTADTASGSDPYLSLREAIVIVNSPSLPTGLSAQIRGQISGTLHASGTDSIVFDHTQVSAPILLGGTTLTLSLPSRTARITIDGGSGVTVDGNNRSGVFTVNSGVTATLDHLTLTHGTATEGGAISNSGTLTVNNSIINSNTAGGGGSPGAGGGIYNNSAATLTVTNSTLSSNVASGSVHGPGKGGAIYNIQGMLTIRNSTLSSNTAAVGAGDFSAGGGIYSIGTLTVTSSTLAANSAQQGGGIGSDSRGGSTTVTVSNSTLISNSAMVRGGGIFSPGTATVSNSTLTGNSAGVGGGIYTDGTLTVTNSTFTANSASSRGGAIYNGAGTLHLRNTIVAGNHSSGGANSGPDLSASVSSSSSYNLVGIQDSSLTGISNGTNHNRAGTPTNPLDPRLSFQGFHGGPMLTVALLSGSPALNTGDPTQAGTPDQRGVVRSGGVNIGAFQASAESLVLFAPPVVNAGTSFVLTVAAYDRFDQLAVGFTGTVTLSSTDPHAVLPPPHTFTLADGGTFLFSGVILNTVGPEAVNATHGRLSGSRMIAVRP